AEVGDLRTDHVEQLQHDRADTTEVPGSRGSFQHILESLDLHPGREALRINRLPNRGEDQVDALGPADFEIALKRPWVAREVLARTELRRVDEERQHDEARLTASGPDQADVPLVQRSHRRYEANAQPLRPGGGNGPADLLDGSGHERRHGF